MGYAVAEAAVRRGAKVILVSGPTDLRVPEGVDWVPVNTSRRNARAVLDRAAEANIVVMAAAVADYRPAATNATKLKRGETALTLQLEPTPDILGQLGREKGSRESSSASPPKPIASPKMLVPSSHAKAPT